MVYKLYIRRMLKYMNFLVINFKFCKEKNLKFFSIFDYFDIYIKFCILRRLIYFKILIFFGIEKMFFRLNCIYI